MSKKLSKINNGENEMKTRNEYLKLSSKENYVKCKKMKHRCNC